MITAHSLRKAPPTVAEQLATKDEAPGNKKTILFLLGMAAVLAYARSFFGEGQALAGPPPAAPGTDAQQGAAGTDAGLTDALTAADPGTGGDAADEPSDRGPADEVLPVADSAFVFEPVRSFGDFEIGGASAEPLAMTEQLVALNPLAYRELGQGQSGFAFEQVVIPGGNSDDSSGNIPVRVPLDTAGQDLSDPSGGTGVTDAGSGTGSTGGTDGGTGTGGTDAGTGGTDSGSGTGSGTGSGGTGGSTGNTDAGTGSGGTGGGSDAGGATGGTDAGGATGGGNAGGGTPVAGTSVPGTQPVRIGTGIADVQIGSAAPDQVFGLGGDDNIDAGDGDDYVDGGLGADLIAGRYGADTLLGGEGDDVLDGGAGDDILYGQDGDDRLFGMQGNDILFGGAGSDALFGGIGADILSGGDGADILAGDDGDDRLDGQAGRDRLFDGLGRDVVSGGEGDDWLSAAKDADEDMFFGNAGVDMLDLSAFDTGLTIDLGDQTVAGPAAVDRFSGFEQVLGGSGDDLFQAGAAGMTLAGGAGADVFDFTLVPGTPPGQAMAFFKITDFQAGDTLRLPGNLTLASLSGPDGLFGLTQAEPTLAERMGQARDYTQDSGAARLRFATEASDSLVHTVITADVDNDGAWDFEVSVDGWVPSDAVPRDFHLTQPLQQ